MIYTKNFECQGLLCHPTLLARNADKVHNLYINICTANSEDEIHWNLPPGWYTINNKLHCPRCFKEATKDK